MKRLIKNLFNSKKTTKPTTQRVRPMIEHLESRLVMDATFWLNAGTLTINGTDNDDIIQVDQVSNFSTIDRSDRDIGDLLQIPQGKGDLAALETHKIRLTCATNALAEPMTAEFFASEVDEIVIKGHRGNDIIRNYTSIRSTIEGGVGHDTLIGGDSADEILGGQGVDIIYGQGGNDRLAGDLIEDNLSKFAGSNNFVFGGAGDDTIWGSGADDWLMGGSGADTMFGRGGDDLMVGDRSTFANYENDNWGYVNLPLQIYSIDVSNDSQIDADDGAAGDDTMYGGSGNDAMYGMHGDDVMYGGNDSSLFVSGRDMLDGGGGRDALFGEDGNDDLYGGDHDDQLYGGSGHDNMFGGDGDDILAGGTNSWGGLKPDPLGDWMEGGEGEDTIYFDESDVVDNIPGAFLFAFYPWVLEGEHVGFKVYVA